jgi:hypothetical protein
MCSACPEDSGAPGGGDSFLSLEQADKRCSCLLAMDERKAPIILWRYASSCMRPRTAWGAVAKSALRGAVAMNVLRGAVAMSVLRGELGQEGTWGVLIDCGHMHGIHGTIATRREHHILQKSRSFIGQQGCIDLSQKTKESTEVMRETLASTLCDISTLATTRSVAKGCRRSGNGASCDGTSCFCLPFGA